MTVFNGDDPACPTEHLTSKKIVEQWITDRYGPRCVDYSPQCNTCDAWEEFDTTDAWPAVEPAVAAPSSKQTLRRRIETYLQQSRNYGGSLDLLQEVLPFLGDAVEPSALLEICSALGVDEEGDAAKLKANALAGIEAWKAEVELTTHKVITCGVAASHPNPNLSRTGVYAGKWDSPQAQKIRALRDERDRLLAERASEPPTDAIDFRALAGRLRKVGGVIRKTYEWQAGELEVIAEDLDGLSPTKNAAPPSAIPFSVRWAMNQLLQDLPKDRDWLNPDIEKIFRQHQWQPETKSVHCDDCGVTYPTAPDHPAHGKPCPVEACTTGETSDSNAHCTHPDEIYSQDGTSAKCAHCGADL